MITFRTWIHVLFMSVMLFHRPCSALHTGQRLLLPCTLPSIGHFQRLASPPRPRRCKSGASCSFRQEVAQAVLDLVASPMTMAQQRHNKQHHSRPTKPSKHNQTAAADTSSNPTVRNSISDLQLHDFIHHLPAPAAPPAWWELCSATTAGGLAGLQAGLASHKCKLPDVQGSAAAHCQLGRHPWVYTFDDPGLSAFAASLFTSIVQGRAAAAKQLGAPPPQLTRFDLFHGHIFVAYDCAAQTDSQRGAGRTGEEPSLSSNSSFTTNQPIQHQAEETNKAWTVSSSSSSSTGGSGRRRRRTLQVKPPSPSAKTPSSSSSIGCQVGILFHAAEYPAYDDDAFPINLGYCQANSSFRFSTRAMDLRNILWWQGQLAVLDAGEDSPLYELLLHDGTQPLRTVYEQDFGTAVADLLLLRPGHQRRRRRMSAEIRSWDRQLKAEAAAVQDRSSSCSKQRPLHGVFVSY